MPNLSTPNRATSAPFPQLLRTLTALLVCSKTASSSSSSHPAPAATQPPTPSPPPPATADSTPYPLSFAALANLIATGAPIPGIKDIPDKLAEGAPSVSTAQVQKKPWEGVVGAAEERAGGGGPVHNAKVKEEGSGQV